ncbi:N-acetyltransferase family protein [Sinirhodobacter sp. WL0062]|uniref:N-acetyltransferase family protein n=1 Tax=Rhodobacter flavimaris TaxID=2907145 RepID=A0ABS8YPT1_9RHOB|nr:GNAT family N-acetyltransferase [Sinirhodobacter sp. WL0062]MCE5971904.1 N-acetyltransferase family protein [Sinirhodobacter sp. WL0062]
MIIRPATPADYDAILAFWNPVIRDTTVTFSSEEKTGDSLGAMIAARRDAGQEFLLAEEAGQVLGFVTYGQFRGGNGYRHAMEHTIILAPEARGRGAGRALMDALEAHARAGGVHIMMGGISAENAAGVAFHAAVGYVEVGRVREAGRKFDRWIDLVLMQKIL